MLPKRSIPPFATAFAMVLIGAAIPQAEVTITLITAGLLVAGYGVYVFFTDREREEPPLVDDEKHIVLFKQQEPVGEDSVACPHCGEVYGLGIKVCPRCKRSRTV